jgi:ribosomal-protein-serine acetyltransferase
VPLTAAVELEAGLVTLRRWPDVGAEVAHRIVSESLEHLAPWMPWAVPGYSLADARAYVDRCTQRWGIDYDYAIVAPDAAVVGSCSLVGRIGPGGLEIGYWVHPGHVGRGYAGAAAAALVAEAFRIGADRVEIVHDAANVRSGAIPRRLGFTEVERRPGAGERTAGESGVNVVWRLLAPNR